MPPLRLFGDYIWRLFATNLAFLIFGVGALILSLLGFPSIHLFAVLTGKDREWAYKRCQVTIHYSFRLFVAVVVFLGLFTYEVTGADKLKGVSSTLIVANHPTLLDVVFILSMVPMSLCVVKLAAWSNPFLMGIMRGAGYIPSDDPFKLIEDCVSGLESGNNLVIFPEATRSVRGQPMKLKRGAASVVSKFQKPFIPIKITCDPPTLSKEDKWYLPAPSKAHYKFTILDKYDPRPEIVDIEQLSLSNRQVNRIFERLFSAKVQ